MFFTLTNSWTILTSRSKNCFLYLQKIGLKGGEAANKGHVTCIVWISFQHSVPPGFEVFWRLNMRTMDIRTVSGMTWRYHAWEQTAWFLGSLIWSCQSIPVLSGLLWLHTRVSEVLKHWWPSVSAGGLLQTPIAGPHARVSDSAGLGVGWLRICISHEFPGDATSAAHFENPWWIQQAN